MPLNPNKIKTNQQLSTAIVGVGRLPAAYNQTLVQSSASGCFAFFGPATWNGQPSDLHTVLDTGDV